VIGRFYIGDSYYILHAWGNKIENLAVFNLADFRNLPNHQNKFYAKFSSYTVNGPPGLSYTETIDAVLVLMLISYVIIITILSDTSIDSSILNDEILGLIISVTIIIKSL